ncbi:hypothetical protein Tco_0223934 [Tanacetum coccineum]
MANFPRLQELVATKNSNNLNEAMSVNDMRMLSSELNLFGGPLAVQCTKYLKQLSKIEVLGMLELRKTIVEVHKKIDFLQFY